MVSASVASAFVSVVGMAFAFEAAFEASAFEAAFEASAFEAEFEASALASVVGMVFALAPANIVPECMVLGIDSELD